MAQILCIETTTTNCSVALSKDGQAIAIREFNNKKYSHSEKLHTFIQEVLAVAALTYSDLDAIAISKGPGSYTGLRIGVSAAKGLCFAKDLPLIATDTLKALALQADRTEFDYVIPMLDARRMEVYTAVYDKDLKVLEETQALVLDNTSFDPYLSQGKICFIGNGSSKFKELRPEIDAVFMEGLPSSREMSLLAEEKYQTQEFEDLAYFEPYYLKDFKV